MPKVRVIAGTIANGRDARPGEVLNLDVTTAKALIRAGKAVPYVLEADKAADREIKTTPKKDKK